MKIRRPSHFHHSHNKKFLLSSLSRIELDWSQDKSCRKFVRMAKADPNSLLLLHWWQMTKVIDKLNQYRNIKNPNFDSIQIKFFLKPGSDKRVLQLSNSEINHQIFKPKDRPLVLTVKEIQTINRTFGIEELPNI